MNGTATPVTVSYRPYQSKRHSRNSSGLGSSAGFSPPGVWQHKVPGSSSSDNAHCHCSLPIVAISLSLAVAHNTRGHSGAEPNRDCIQVAIAQSQAPDTQTLPTPSPTPEQPASTESSSQPTSPLTQLPALPASRPGSETAGPSSPGPSSPTSSTAPSPRPTIVQRPGSRFRVVSTRGLSANTQPARPSPLRPASHLSPGPSTPTAPTHTRTLSNASTPVSPSPVSKLPASVSAPVPFNERLSPGNRNKPLPAPGSAIHDPILTPVPAPRSTTPVAAPSPTSNTPVPYAVLSRTSSASPVPTNIPGVNSPSRPAPYRAGFQPKELLQLIDLHFSPKEKDDAPPPPNRRSSSFFDDLAELKNKSPNELWRGVVESKAAQQERAIRTAEQTITKWEDDKDVSACPICTYVLIRPLHTLDSYHEQDIIPPPHEPQTPLPTLWSSQVPDVIAYGVTLDGEKDNKYVKGVRICRTCRAVVSKQQYNIEAATIPAFSRIYQALLRLEGQIEDDLPQNGTHSNPSATSTTAAARKSLLDRFHEYDRLAKRLRALPLLDDPGHAIQPLLEQEAVLEQMLAEAQAARKIEDAQTLKANLTEIRNEIRRFMR
ncbi:Rabenosyn Rab binding domain [Rhizoctonia solani]|uniref:Rabenosyn Rab binding domain n=1 Tax=Rhizoctonia solani TaxID=456999 RepID=A0A8H7IJ04_9AGAM|nr:Rabenosyn Rab binding domain [Rhizoctonia solani]